MIKEGKSYKISSNPQRAQTVCSEREWHTGLDVRNISEYLQYIFSNFTFSLANGLYTGLDIKKKLNNATM